MSSPLDLAGIGIGPFNLSLAAHMDSVDGANAIFFDQRPQFAWHPGMMLPGVELQTSFLKDLVTATIPTSPWSFMAYLVAHKRFYEFMNADFEAIPRQEFAQYLAWVAAGLGSLRFGHALRAVEFENNAFRLRFDSETYTARNLAIGVGSSPFLPKWADGMPTTTCFHSSVSADRLDHLTAERIVVVGGGQSGAEIVDRLLSTMKGRQRKITWVSRRANFHSLDETPFADEYFTPSYVERFHPLDPARKADLVQGQKLASDGISISTLRSLYRQIYALRHFEGNPKAIELLPARTVAGLAHDRGHYRIVMKNAFDDSVESLDADAVILATGYETRLPDFMAPLADRLSLDAKGRYRLNADFSATWNGPDDRRIFVLNAGRHSHGIAEPQLSLMAWRSAMIVNSLLGHQHFDLEMPPSIATWAGRHGMGEWLHKKVV